MKKIYYLAIVSLFLLVPYISFAGNDLSKRLSGRILLQVENSGEAWYVEPTTQERAFLGRPDDAFRIMRELGLGIAEKDFNSFGEKAPQRLSGRILLRVEANGEAYYINPVDLKMYFLGRPSDAFGVMRQMGLGVTNQDIEKVPVFQKYAQQTEANSEAIKSLEEKLLEQNNKINELENKLNENANSPTPAPTPIPAPTPTPTPPANQACTSWNYSDWSACSINGRQTRIILDALPNGCVGGTAEIERFCEYVEPQVILDFNTNKTSVYSGETVYLTWSAQNAQSCIASGGTGWNGAKDINGSQSVVVNSNSYLKLDCQNSSGIVSKVISVDLMYDIISINIIPNNGVLTGYHQKFHTFALALNARHTSTLINEIDVSINNNFGGEVLISLEDDYNNEVMGIFNCSSSNCQA